MRYKEYQHTISYRDSNQNLDTCCPRIFPIMPPKCWWVSLIIILCIRGVFVFLCAVYASNH